MAERSNTPENVAYSKVRVKKEDDGDSRVGHSHKFNVKFKARDPEEHTFLCDRPQTLLEAIKSHEEYQKTKECADENIIIQLGKGDKEYAVPTHFPCSCIEDEELVTMLSNQEKVEKAQNKCEAVHPRDKYSVFYIDREGGKYTKTKKIFRSEAIKQFKYLCVYGEKGMTVEESLKRDGRFIDDLGDFKLSDNENPNRSTGCKQKVDSLDGKKFKLCLPLNKRENDEELQKKPCASNSSQRQCDSAPVVDAAQQRGTSVKTLLEKRDSNVNTEEIYKILHQQFPHLKEWMEKRFPGDSYQKAVNLRRKNFGKIQQSFSEVHRVRKLLKLGKSVCLLKVDCFSVTTQGTGFVLFDNLILTNAHLFNEVTKLRRDNWKKNVKVTAVFNHENPDLETNSQSFNVKDFFVDLGDTELDYAVLELDLEGQTPNQTTETVKVPPGLLKRFGPVPPDGEACIIGHPAGDVKKMDPTCIIEKENRVQAVNEHLEPYRNTCFIIQSISQVIRNQGIVTYNTFMYHGSSGSPVFDAHCRVFGLHTAGFVYGFPKKKSVIEFAQPLLTIFKRLVTKIQESGDKELLKRVEEEANGNPYLEDILKSLKLNESSSVEEAKRNPDPDEEVKDKPEDSDESMDTRSSEAPGASV
ncbi:serine protease FAM111A-like isoform X1 [Thunnus albacares]|uniref:serine protease FAM111A-like isoform X1 n=1 Tax=Thunnus albacares TaxID=8236 RepID=UPI001CF60630|nr:serine protease FAM111A-like isoform X1 [Thunnus albacares]XP_044197926.1 serine protease FAM111A-like isoform X1 [Thunnus albacares]